MKDEPFRPSPEDEPPPGYVARENPRGPFSVTSGPFYDRPVETGRCRGFRVKPHHCNGLGIAHGGMLMTFADELLGSAVTHSSGGRALTLRLNADFLSMAREGDWIDGLATVTRMSRSIAFVECRLSVGERTVLMASGVFKMMRGRQDRAAQGRADAGGGSADGS